MTPSLSGRNAIALAAACLASLMFGLEISSVPVILPTLDHVLGADFQNLQWVMNAYTIACTTVLMATGTLADRYGRKVVFIISIVAFGVTSVVCGLAQNISLLIAARFLQGMSGGAMLICQIAILSHQFQDGRARGNAFGIWGIVFGIGLGFGPIIGGAIVAVSNWQWVFLVHGLIAVLTLLLTLAGVQESKDPQAGRVDLAGIATLSLAVFCLVYYITQGASLGFASPVALGILAAAAISFIGFVLVERATSQPMVDFAIFKIRDFSGALLGSVGMNVSFWPFMIYLPIYFQTALGYDTVTAGLALLAYTVPTLLVPPLAERLALRYRPGVVIPAGLFTIGLGFVAMALGSHVDHASWITLLPGCLLAGAGTGLTNTPVTNTTTGAVPPARAGMASGIDMSARMIALATNIALMGFILTEGIKLRLASVLPVSIDPQSLQSAAERIVSGAASTADTAAVASDAVVRAALTQGFGLVMLYGGIGVWLLAAISFAVFRPTAKRDAASRASACESM